MHRRAHTKTGVVTESAVQATLRRGSTPALAADEERLLRMRVGAGLPLSARLERIAAASDTEIELLAYEIEAHLALKERRARQAAPNAARTSGTARAARTAHDRPARSETPVPARAGTTSRTKEKIVRALRRKS